MNLSKPEGQSSASTITGTDNAAPEISNEELLAAYVKGDEKAFEALVDNVGNRLFAFVRRTMRHDAHAEDVFQVVLVKIATKAHLFRKGSNLMAWLFQITRNACVDTLRREGRRPEVSLDGGGTNSGAGLKGMVAAEAPDPAAKLANAELANAINRAVETLPDEQREVFLLKEEGELTFEEIGDILGCGKETAKSRMRYALERLRNSLGKEARSYGLQ